MTPCFLYGMNIALYPSAPMGLQPRCCERYCLILTSPSPLPRYVPSQPQAEVVRHSVHYGPEVYMSHSNPSTHNNTAQMDLLRENERLRKELEVYSEKAARLQKVRDSLVTVPFGMHRRGPYISHF